MKNLSLLLMLAVVAGMTFILGLWHAPKTTFSMFILVVGFITLTMWRTTKKPKEPEDEL